MALVSGCYTELSRRGVLQIRGPDTRKFLQGQTTCDLDLLTAGRSLRGAYCTPKGRVVCDFRILGCGDDRWLLGMDRGICEYAATVFGKYIVFSRAELGVASDAWRCFAVWGSEARATLELGERREDETWEQFGAWWVQTDADGERFECQVEAERAGGLEDMLADKLGAAPETHWQLLEINAGLAHIEPETVELFIPQNLNYQLTGHISFNKGCYTGQEVVARMHYRGKVKQPMYLAGMAAAPGAGEPAPGASLYSPGSEQSVGQVVNCAPQGESIRLLATVKSAAIEGGVHLGDPGGPELHFHPLPYELGAP